MTIAEVSKKFNITTDTLRYYERIGLIPSVTRNKSGIRDYSEDDCRWIEFVKCMRSAGLTIEVLNEYLELYQLGDITIDERKQLLINQKKLLEEKIKEMEKTVERLSYKIDTYNSKIVNIEDKYLKREEVLIEN